MRLWLILALSAAAPLNPIVDKKATKENLVTDDIDRVDIAKGGDMDGDGLHSHTSQNTARDARLVFHGGDVILSGSIDITCDHACIASIISNHVSMVPKSPSSSYQDHQPVPAVREAEAAVDGVRSDWGECSPTCGEGSQSRTCDNPSPANGGTLCVGGADQVCFNRCGEVIKAIRALRMLIRKMKKDANGFPVAIIETIAKAKEYLEDCTSDCQSTKLWEFINNPLEIFPRIKVSGIVTSVFLEEIEKETSTLEAAKVLDIFEPPTLFTVCNSKIDRS